MNPNILSKIVFSLVLFLLSAQLFAQISVRVDRNPIAEGETLQLFIEVKSQSQNVASLDTSPLKQDFEVLGTTQSSSVVMVNGRVDASLTYTVRLAPKRSGELVIPALQIAGESSQPQTITVTEAPVASADAGSPVFLEASVDQDSSYVQAMLRYRVKLFYNNTLVEAQLSEPQMDQALVRRIGEDEKYQQQRAQQNYNVLEREYAIFPQSSGVLTIPAPVLDGKVMEFNNRQRSFFGSSYRQTRVRGEAISVEVLPRPAQATGVHWLPAQSLQLSETWQPEQTTLNEGDLLTRTITLEAIGLMGEQLPDFTSVAIPGFQVYPDQASPETSEDQGVVNGSKTQTITYVSNQAGEFELPAIKLAWWDVSENKQRFAELPARKIRVKALAGAQTAPSDRADSPVLSAPVSNPANLSSEKTPNSTLWQGIAAAFALLWLLTLFVWWWTSRALVNNPNKQTSRDKSSASSVSGLRRIQAKTAFHKACKSNDAKRSRETLLAWAALHWQENPPRGLQELAKRIGRSDISELLIELDQQLYQTQSRHWEGASLAKALKVLPEKAKTDKTNELPGLYGV